MAANDEALRYYKDATPEAWARRLAISVTLGLFLAVSLSGWLQVLSLVAPEFARWGAALLSFIPEQARKLPWGRGSTITVAFCFGFALLPSRVPRVLDYLLFPSFDDETLQRISRETGIFKWLLPDSGGQYTAWESLVAWAEDGVTDGRWKLNWIFDKPRLPRSFAWTILIGANASGKTQLAKELGRYLARRSAFGDSQREAGRAAYLRQSGLRLASWWRRVLPWHARRAHDPWDAGLIVNVRHDEQRTPLKLLGSWLPAAPTLLILDDPPLDTCKRVIEILEERKDRFWYPVRLLIVDQFVPADLPIEADHDRAGWHFEEAPSLAFRPVVLGEEIFDLVRYRKVLAGGFWMTRSRRLGLQFANEMQALYASEAVEMLVGKLEGNPLLLALATLWLAEDRKRTVADLMQTNLLNSEEQEIFAGEQSNLKALVAHRLIRERVEDLYKAYSRNETAGEASIRKSVACATIADGISHKKAKELFGLSFEQSVLRRIFPDVDGVVRTIPALRPWVLGESFVHKLRLDVLHDSTSEFESLIGHAYVSNPRGTLKALVRRGSLAGAVAAAIDRLPAPDQPADRLAVFMALTEHALYLNEAALGRALSAAATLEDDSVFHAVRQFEILSRSDHGSLPYGLPRLAIYCCLAERMLRQEPHNAELRETVLRRMNHLLQTVSTFKYVEEQLRALLCSAFNGVCRQLLEVAYALESREAMLDMLEQLHEFVIRQLELELLKELATKAAPQAYVPNDKRSIARLYVEVWFMRKLVKERDLAGCEEAVKRISSQLDAAGMDRRWTTLLAARAWCYLAWGQSEADAGCDTVEATAGVVDEIVRARPGDADIQSLRAAAWRYVAVSRSKTHDGHFTEQAVQKIGEIAKPFPSHSMMQVQRAVAWQTVAAAYCELPAQHHLVEPAARMVDDIAKPFPDHADLQWMRAQAWKYVAFASLSPPDQIHLGQAQARIVDDIARPFRDNLHIQLERAETWRYVALAGETHDRIELTEVAARMIDDIAEPFLHDSQMQTERAIAWSSVAGVRSNIPDQRRFAEQAARKVDSIAQRFLEERIHEARAAAWFGVAWAAWKEFNECQLTEPAIAMVDKTAELFPRNLNIRRHRVRAWTLVANMRSMTPEQRHLTDEAARLIENIAMPFAGEINIQIMRANAWCSVAFAQAQTADQRCLVEETARRVDNIAQPFPDDEDIRFARARAWGMVAEARSKIPEQRHLTEAAACVVDEITKRFLHHAGMQGIRCVAWVIAGITAHDMGQRDEALANFRKCLEIGSRFAGHPTYASTFAASVRNASQRLAQLHAPVQLNAPSINRAVQVQQPPDES